MEQEKSNELEVVNQKTGEIIEKYPPTPEDLLLAASEAAKALERVIELNDRPPIMFNGKRYLEFHHWQTIGKFYHVTTRTMDAVSVEVGGVAGFKARAEAVDEKTGQVVGSAEAYCLRDEPNWKSKPTFQLASMAQTRAASKALSNKFRFVAIVAGYEGTPSEEMTHDTTSQKQVAMPRKSSAGKVPESKPVPASPNAGSKPSAGTQQTLEAEVVSDPIMAAQAPLPSQQSKFFGALHKVAREKKITAEKMKAAMKLLYNKDSSKDLTDVECADLIKQIEKGAVRG